MQYSVVIPLKDEAENIEALVYELEATMQGLGKPWELICVDDGSQDNTALLLQKLANEKPFLRAIIFNGNYGQSSAFDAGFQTARGEFLITMDGDGQNDPADIPNLVKKMDSSDLVCGYRKKRQDSLLKKWISHLANFTRSRVCQDGVRDTGCSLKIYRTHCLHKLKMYQGMHRFLPALFVIEGFRVSEAPVNHRPRLKGRSHYNLWNRSLNTIVDMFAVHWMRKRRLQYKIAKEIP